MPRTAESYRAVRRNADRAMREARPGVDDLVTLENGDMLNTRTGVRYIRKVYSFDEDE